MKHRLNVLCLVTAALLLNRNGRAVSRVGNNLVADKTDGFQMAVPTPFMAMANTASESVVLRYSARGRGAFGEIPPQLQVRRLAREYPEFKEATRIDFERFFVTSGHAWRKVSAEIPCVTAFFIARAGVVTGIAGWGPGSGVVIVGPASDLAADAVQTMLKEIKLDEGACRWE